MHSKFLKTVEDFLTKSGLEPSKLGYYAVGNPNLVFKLRKGKSCTLRTAERVLAFIEANKNLNFRMVSPVTVTMPATHPKKETADVTSSN